MNASSSSREWKCVTCPETTCSTRPSQPREAPEGWARNCTTNARLVGSVGWGWDTGDLLQGPVESGPWRVVHRMLGRYTTRPVQDHGQSVQIEGRGAPEAFK